MSRFFSVRAVLVLGFAVVVPFFLFGCAAADPASKVESGARKVITFDGGAVTEGEVRQEISRINKARAAATGQTAPEVDPGSPQFEAAKARVLPQLLVFDLAKAYARENGIDVSGQEIQDEVDSAKGEIAQQAAQAGENKDPEELFQEALNQFGFTEDEFREEVRTSLLVKKVQDEAVSEVQPTNEEVQNFYDENSSTLFTVPEQRCIRHILFTQDQEDLANQVKQQLESGEGDFAELAQQYSQDPGSKQRGGDLGCQPQGGFAPEFDKAAFSADEGEIVGPVKTDFGYHIIEVTQIQPEKQTPLEEARPQIEQRLGQQRQASDFDAWIQDQLDQRDVRYLPGYNPQQPALPGAPPGGAQGGGAPGG